jgi:hypothetical protein
MWADLRLHTISLLLSWTRKRQSSSVALSVAAFATNSLLSRPQADCICSKGKLGNFERHYHKIFNALKQETLRR